MSVTPPSLEHVGLFDWWRTAAQLQRYAAETTARTLATPFAGEATLSSAITISDLFDLKQLPISRAEAMSVPAVARGRHLIAETLARQPLVAYDATGTRLSDQPAFLYRSKYFPPRLRVMWTIDDLIFHGWSLWALDKGSPDQRSGRADILDAVRIDPKRWRQQDGQVVVTDPRGRDVVLEDGTYLLFPGPTEGLLSVAARTVRGARQLEEQWLARVKNPIPLVEIRYTGDEDLEDDEMRDIRKTYIDARNDENGVVMVTPRGFEIVDHGASQLDLFVQGRNAVSLDVARFLNLPAAMLDASNVNGSSVNYENLTAGRAGYADLTLRSWALPIEEALSQDDVLPRGQYIAFDLSSLVVAPDTGTGPALED